MLTAHLHASSHPSHAVSRVDLRGIRTVRRGEKMAEPTISVVLRLDATVIIERGVEVQGMKTGFDLPGCSDYNFEKVEATFNVLLIITHEGAGKNPFSGRDSAD